MALNRRTCDLIIKVSLVIQISPLVVQLNHKIESFLCIKYSLKGLLGLPQQLSTSSPGKNQLNWLMFSPRPGELLEELVPRIV